MIESNWPAHVRVALGQRSYDVVIGAGIAAQAGGKIAPMLRRPFLPVITDTAVALHWREPVAASLAAAGIEAHWLVLPPGESTKSWSQLETVVDWLLALEIERSDCVLALGGGVIGDLVGFAAAITKRGCQFIQMPTSLLAQVDSSVGGKTAINSARGKNLVGLFHQPQLVLADPAMLSTLPPRELRAGYAEVVKYGLIDDPDFFGWCEQHGAALLAGDIDRMAQAVLHSVRAKARIVSADEHERSGTRALLNLGHTFGHALEAETGYGARLLHGEAVAAGMALAARFSAHQGLMSATDAARIVAHLESVGLPVTLQQAGVDCDGAQLVAHMLHDKKREGGTLPFLLLHGIGKTYLDRTVDLADVAAFLDQTG